MLRQAAEARAPFNELAARPSGTRSLTPTTGRLSMTSGSYFAGIDWASQSHSVCVLDAAGRVELRLELAHNQEGIERLLRQLKSFAGVVIAIERPSGLLVDALRSEEHTSELQ